MAVLNFPSDPSTQTPVNTYSPDSTPLASDNGVTYVWDGEKWTATTSSNFLPLSGGTLTGDLTVPSLNGGPLAGLRNQLINGDFRIWQRGDSVDEVTPVGIWIGDRWTYAVNVDTVVTKSEIAPAGISNSCFIENAIGTNCQQKIELPGDGNPGPFAVGTQWTYSFWSTVDPTSTENPNPFLQFRDRANPENNTNAATFTPYRVLETSGSFTRYAFTATINAAPNPTNDSLVVLVPCPASGPINFTGVQLEPGPVATPFEQRPIGLELSLCERYFMRKQIRAVKDESYCFVFPTTPRIPNPNVTNVGTHATTFTVLDGSMIYVNTSSNNTHYIDIDAEL